MCKDVNIVNIKVFIVNKLIYREIGDKLPEVFIKIFTISALSLRLETNYLRFLLLSF